MVGEFVMINNPSEINISDFMQALQNINATDEQEKLESIEILGNTIGFLTDKTTEEGAIILLGAKLTQKDENKIVKEAARTALRKIEDRCKLINDKMDLSIFALTYLQENHQEEEKKKKNKPLKIVIIVVAIVLVVLLVICLFSGVALFLGN